MPSALPLAARDARISIDRLRNAGTVNEHLGWDAATIEAGAAKRAGLASLATTAAPMFASLLCYGLRRKAPAATNTRRVGRRYSYVCNTRGGCERAFQTGNLVRVAPEKALSIDVVHRSGQEKRTRSK